MIQRWAIAEATMKFRYQHGREIRQECYVKFGGHTAVTIKFAVF